MIIDANIFLEFLLKQKKFEECRIFLNKTVTGEIKAIISNFSVDSIIILMARNNLNVVEIETFLKKLVNSRGINIYFFNIKDRFNALLLMDKYGLDYEDAIVLQSAFATGSKEIVSFDKHFDKIKEIKRIEP